MLQERFKTVESFIKNEDLKEIIRALVSTKALATRKGKVAIQSILLILTDSFTDSNSIEALSVMLGQKTTKNTTPTSPIELKAGVKHLSDSSDCPSCPKKQKPLKREPLKVVKLKGADLADENEDDFEDENEDESEKQEKTLGSVEEILSHFGQFGEDSKAKMIEYAAMLGVEVKENTYPKVIATKIFNALQE